MPPLLEKNRKKKENYRPILIMNRNMKILKKILAIVFPEKKRIKKNGLYLRNQVVWFNIGKMETTVLEQQ